MAQILLKNIADPGSIPTNLAQGEVAINTADGILFYSDNAVDNIKQIKGNPFPYTGSVIITGSLTVTGSTKINVDYLGTSSIALEVNNTTLVDNIPGNEYIGTGIQGTGQYGVRGITDEGVGVYGEATDSGYGVQALGNNSAGLYANGNPAIQAAGDVRVVGSLSQGIQVTTSGNYSHAEGYYTTASGDYSHAEGVQTHAFGNYSHAEGYFTTASGSYSHAEGASTVASGDWAHAEGANTVAQGNYQHVQGQFNLSSSVQSAFIHGNGTSDANRSNLIYAAGTAVEITGSLKVTGSYYLNNNKLFNYGQFSSAETQSGSANTAYAMKLGTTDITSGVTVTSNGTFPTRITVANTGIYNLQFSSQLGNTANSTIDFDIWFAYTGSNVANSNTQMTINKVAGSVGRLVAAWNFMTPIQANDYIEIMWNCTAATGQLQAAGTQTTPTRPAIPSVIATLTQIA